MPALAAPIYRLYDPLFVTAETATAIMQQALLVPVRRNVSPRVRRQLRRVHGERRCNRGT